jgi:hypothetical protein
MRFSAVPETYEQDPHGVVCASRLFQTFAELCNGRILLTGWIYTSAPEETRTFQNIEAHIHMSLCCCLSFGTMGDVPKKMSFQDHECYKQTFRRSMCELEMLRYFAFGLEEPSCASGVYKHNHGLYALFFIPPRLPKTSKNNEKHSNVLLRLFA